MRRLLCLAALISSLQAGDSFKGKLFHINPESRTFDLLKETEYDPQADLTQSRYPCQWVPDAVIRRISEASSWQGIKGPVWVEFRGLDARNQAAAESGKAFVARVATVIEGVPAGAQPAVSGNQVCGWFTPADEPGSRAGTVLLGGKPVAVRLRDKHWRIHVHSLLPPAALTRGFWQAELTATRRDGGLVVERMDVTPLPDPRETDDPRLPRVLVIGDSISMNYHDAAKQALEGIANYHRIEGNAFSSEHGVANTPLWLGDYTQRGLHWDVIQFNHGLHDLKQVYDEAGDTWGDYAVDPPTYQKNLEKQIALLRKTGARLVWCTTTPVPNNRPGPYARRKGAAALFNAAALEVMKKHPDIVINDLHAAIEGAAVFDEWRKGSDVHFYKENERRLLGGAVAASIQRALMPKAKKLPLQGQASTMTFPSAGSQAFLILPEKGKLRAPTPWVWYAPTLPGLPGKAEEWMFRQLLDQGIAIAGMDVGESMGNPAGRAKFDEFYRDMTGQKLCAKKPCLLARSRGGLMLYNWAVENPECVSGIAGIYPVSNLASWPGLKKAAPAYGLSEKQLADRLAEHNPVDRLGPLAKAGVPLFHLHGDNDRIVPLEPHSGLLRRRYTELGGSMTLKVVPGGGHDMKDHWFRSQELVDFVIDVLKVAD